MTQRDLAERLAVTDKAVSKWERGAGMPDISMLMPLAEALGVTVTELLEARRIEPEEPVPADKAEELVRRVIDLSGSEPPRGGPDRKKWGLLYGLCLVLALGEMAWMIRQILRGDQALSAGFGLYFCLFARTRLPWYHDVGRIGMYYDGPLRMNVPGVRFSNRNWPHILRGVRVWSLLSMTLSGVLCQGAKRLFGPGPIAGYLPMVSLAGLVAAIYVPGRKYE